MRGEEQGSEEEDEDEVEVEGKPHKPKVCCGLRPRNETVAFQSRNGRPLHSENIAHQHTHDTSIYVFVLFRGVLVHYEVLRMISFCFFVFFLGEAQRGRVSRVLLLSIVLLCWLRTYRPWKQHSRGEGQTGSRKDNRRQNCAER